MRVRAWEREKAWAPRYVANELAGTRQAAAHHHQTAALRSAEADAAAAAGDSDGSSRLSREAAEAAALAAALDQQAATLQQLDDARAQWLAHTAMTRTKAERAQAMLAERHAADIDPAPVVTAEEWLAAHRDADSAEDDHRAITDADLPPDAADNGDQLAADTTTGRAAAAAERDGQAARREPAPGPGVRDIREIAADEPAQVAEDVDRVPTATETAQADVLAGRSIAEIRARHAEEEREAEQQRAAELNRWHDQDHATDLDAAAGHDTTDGCVGVDDADGYARDPEP